MTRPALLALVALAALTAGCAAPTTSDVTVLNSTTTCSISLSGHLMAL